MLVELRVEGVPHKIPYELPADIELKNVQATLDDFWNPLVTDSKISDEMARFNAMLEDKKDKCENCSELSKNEEEKLLHNYKCIGKKLIEIAVSAAKDSKARKTDDGISDSFNKNLSLSDSGVPASSNSDVCGGASSDADSVFLGSSRIIRSGAAFGGKLPSDYRTSPNSGSPSVGASGDRSDYSNSIKSDSSSSTAFGGKLLSDFANCSKPSGEDPPAPPSKTTSEMINSNSIFLRGRGGFSTTSSSKIIRSGAAFGGRLPSDYRTSINSGSPSAASVGAFGGRHPSDYSNSIKSDSSSASSKAFGGRLPSDFKPSGEEPRAPPSDTTSEMINATSIFHRKRAGISAASSSSSKITGRGGGAFGGKLPTDYQNSDSSKAFGGKLPSDYSNAGSSSKAFGGKLPSDYLKSSISSDKTSKDGDGDSMIFSGPRDSSTALSIFNRRGGRGAFRGNLFSDYIKISTPSGGMPGLVSSLSSSDSNFKTFDIDAVGSTTDSPSSDSISKDNESLFFQIFGPSTDSSKLDASEEKLPSDCSKSPNALDDAWDVEIPDFPDSPSSFDIK